MPTEPPYVIETRGPYKVTARRTAYENPWIRVIEDEVIRVDGTKGIFGVVEISRGRGGVSVLPVDDKNNILLAREFMYAINRTDVEVAGGGIDGDEDELSAAQRELLEELGLTAREWVDLGRLTHSTSIVRAGTRLYMAKGFDISTLTPENGIEIVSYPIEDAVELVMTGKIEAAVTCALILKAARLLGL